RASPAARAKAAARAPLTSGSIAFRVSGSLSAMSATPFSRAYLTLDIGALSGGRRETKTFPRGQRKRSLRQAQGSASFHLRGQERRLPELVEGGAGAKKPAGSRRSSAAFVERNSAPERSGAAVVEPPCLRDVKHGRGVGGDLIATVAL